MPLHLNLRVLTALLTATLAAATVPAHAEGCKYVNLVELPIQYTGPGLQPAVTGSINDKPAVMLLDTGASLSLVTQTGAEAFQLSQRVTGMTASGVGGFARVYESRVKEFAVGPVKARNRWLRVIGDMAAEQSYAAIIGSDFWMQADFELDLAAKLLRFFRPYQCGETAFLGYWDRDANVIEIESPDRDPRPHVMVKVNGAQVQAIIDSGAARSVLFQRAARRANLNPAEVPLELSGFSEGVGTDRVRTYHARATFQIGDETVKNARLQVAGEDVSIGGGAEMLLGQDWLRAHRTLFANSQRKLYFTWNGTEPFGQTGAPWYTREAEAGNPDAQVLMGLREENIQHHDAARAWIAKAAAQKHPRANQILAFQALEAGHYAQAEQHLRVTLAAQPRNASAALLMYVAQAPRDLQAASKGLQDFLAAAPREEWLRPVAAFYLGQASERDALKAAGTDEDRLCTVHNLVARWYDVNQDAAHAAAVRTAGQPACAAIKRGLL